MKAKNFAMILPAVVWAGVANAAPVGLTFSGEIKANTVGQANYDPLQSAGADIGLSWRNSGAINLGFDAEITSFVPLGSSRDFMDNATTIWGGVVLASDWGDLTLGNPRGIAHDLNLPSETAAAESLESLLGFTGLTKAALIEGGKLSIQTSGVTDIRTVGATFYQGQGPVNYGFGLHQMDVEGSIFDVTEMSLSYGFGAARAYGLYERMQDDFGGAIIKSTLGARYDLEKWNFGVEMVKVDFDQIPMARNKLFVAYHPSDKITLTAQAENFNLDSDSTNVFGVKGEYRFGQNIFAELGVLQAADENVLGFDRLTSLTVGYRF